MDCQSSTDSEKTNGKHNSESSDQEFGQVINDNDCQIFNKNTESPIKPHEQFSQSLFSEETPEIDDLLTKKAIISQTSSKSSDVDQVVEPVELVILETETDSTTDKSSVIMIPDSDEADKSEQQRSIRRKSSDLSPIPRKRTCLEEIRLSESTTNIDSTSTNQSPIRNVPIRSSPRNSPQRNLLNLYKPARRLKKSASFDMEMNNKNTQPFSEKPTSSPLSPASPSPSSIKKNSKLTLRRKRAVSVDVQQAKDSVMSEISSQVELAGYMASKTLKPYEAEKILSGRINPIKSIIEETQNEITSPQRDESQNINPNDSQSMKLFLSPSFDSQNLLSNDVLENEPLLSQDFDNSDNNSGNVILLSQCNPANKNTSNGDIHQSTDQESTVSVNLDSPYYLQETENVVLKAKPYLSNGYSSSTPENDLQEVLLKKSFPLSDSETDNTPPFTNFNKNSNGESKMSISSKSNSSGMGNSSISPLNNGHSNGTNSIDTSNPVPSFHIQMYGDENDDFLSMFIVKTTSDMGIQTLKEYQRFSKRLSFDPYTGDISKSNSPSSVTSGGLYQLPLHPRSSFMSTGSSSSTSSSRTSDGVFIIPQRPKRNLSFHTPVTVKGWQALKQNISEIISKLADLDPTEEPAHSPVNGECKHEQTSPTVDKTSPIENNVKTNDCHRTTPKSSKKKVQTRTKRVLSSRTKKPELTVTNEESLEDIENMSSDINSNEQCASPRLKSNGESFNFTKSTTPRGRKLKNGSAALNLSADKESLQSVISKEQTYPKGTLVLAKWRDKKYYSGKVIGTIDNSKYEIEFYDGQVKTLLDDFIIFGDMEELPLKGQSVYTKVDDVTYEPSLVLSLERTETGEVLYKCTTDRDSMVSVSASDIYLTEDQAKSFHDSNPPRSPHLTPGTPRRRINRDLDLNNIIHEPRSARLRDKGSAKGCLQSPASPKPGPSSLRKGGGIPQRRLESESSEEGDSRASSTVPEDVEGVQPETQSTPRKTRGIKVNYVTKSLIAIKGSSKQKTGKESKVKFETEEEITETLGPMPAEGSTFFSGLHFLLTCTDIPVLREINHKKQNISDSDSYAESSEREEEIMLARIPFTKERLAKQLEMAGGTVYSRFEDIPKSKYNSCRLIVSRPCLTGMYIMCLASNIKALSHLWVIESCKTKKLADYCLYALPTGYSIERGRMISLEERTTCKPFKDKLILLCGENENFTRFWDRVCSLAGANTKIITEDDLDLRYSIAIVTEYSCPTKIINKAEYEKISLVSPTWVVQCLIEGKLLSVNGNVRYMFNYIDT